MARKTIGPEPVDLGPGYEWLEQYDGVGTEDITLDDVTWEGGKELEAHKREMIVHALALEIARRVPANRRPKGKARTEERERADQISAALTGRPPKRGRPERDDSALLRRIGARYAHAYFFEPGTLTLGEIIRDELLQERPTLTEDALENAIKGIRDAFERREDFWIWSATGGHVDETRDLRRNLDNALNALEKLGLFATD